MSIWKPIFWTLINATVITFVWLQQVPWWMVAILVTIDCIVFACDQWQKWFDAERADFYKSLGDES